MLSIKKSIILIEELLTAALSIPFTRLHEKPEPYKAMAYKFEINKLKTPFFFPGKSQGQ